MTKIRVGINGFGRIGRGVLKVIQESHAADMEVVAINDLYDVKTNAHLLKYDTTYRTFKADVSVEENHIKVGSWKVLSFAEKDPKLIPWGKAGVYVVVESTGVFRTGPTAGQHLAAGAKKVIISAPAKEEDLTVVMGVNESSYNPAKHHVLSNASCTTNCLAPAVKVVHDNFGIVSGVMCTIHSYTNDQRILDLPHKDLRRARAAALNIIPTSTGAAKAVALVIPDLKGKFDGYSLRVPTPTVSVVDFSALLEKETSTEELRAKLKAASETYLKGILGFSETPLVSSDYIADPRSSIVDAEFTKVQNGKLAKLVCWYDNEWGYCCRTVDFIKYIAAKGL